ATGLPAAATGAPQYANCNARLIAFVQFTSPCVQGATTSSQIQQVNRFSLNGPGFVTNGLDYTLNYTHPLFDGRLGFNLTATENLVYKERGYLVNGIVFSTGGHRLGYSNTASNQADAMPRWRANASLGWSNDQHNINLRANYNSGFVNENTLT